MLAEQFVHRRDGGACALDQRMAMFGVVDRGRQHVRERHRAVVAQQHHPGVERAGHARGEQPGAGHQVEAELAEMRDGGRRGRRPLAADHLDLALAHIVQDHRHVAARPVEMRLHHLQRERGRDRGVERVAAALQHAHADRRGDPVGRGHDAERAVDLRARGERIRIDVLHGKAVRCCNGRPNQFSPHVTIAFSALQSRHRAKISNTESAGPAPSHGARHCSHPSFRCKRALHWIAQGE